MVQCLIKASKIDNTLPFIHLYASQIALVLLEPSVNSVLFEMRPDVLALLGHEGTAACIQLKNIEFLTKNEPKSLLAGSRLLLVLDASSDCPIAFKSPTAALVDQFTIPVGLLNIDN